MSTNENADYIWELDPLYPKGASDYIANGDDEIRQLKKTTQQTWPNIDKVITASSDEINQLTGNAGIGTIAQYDEGTQPGNAIILSNVGGQGGLPAVDGSQLVNVNTTDQPIADIDIMNLKNARTRLHYFSNL